MSRANCANPEILIRNISPADAKVPHQHDIYQTLMLNATKTFLFTGG